VAIRVFTDAAPDNPLLSAHAFPGSREPIGSMRCLTLRAGFSITIGAMPTYAYVCEKCGHQFDIVQSISAKSLTTCPEDLCGQKRWGKGKVKRAITAGAGLIFKGTGFYITDYRSDKYKEAAKKDTAPSASSSKSESKSSSETKSTTTKADSKPAKSAEKK
jgi:putative FmdB family regulatory protein